MAEYIEKDAFIAHICQEAEGLKTKMPMDLVIAAVVNEVRSFPAADVAPVVRCKDCIWWRRESDHTCRYYGGASPRVAYGYCHIGQKMDGGNDG